MQTVRSELQCSNAEMLRSESLESDSNLSTDRDLHPEKPEVASDFTDEGMQIDESVSQPENAKS
jgi:hypothetical protein